MSRIVGFVLLALRRLSSQAGLVACILLGITIAVAFAAAIPAFVNAAQTRVLRQQLLLSTGRDNAADPANRREALYMRLSCVGVVDRGALGVDEQRQLEAFMRDRIQVRTMLPVIGSGIYSRTDDWAVRPVPGTETAKRYRPDLEVPLTWGSLEVMDGVEDHIQLDEGTLPQDAPPGDGIPVLVHRLFSEKYGARPGDVFSLTARLDEPIVGEDGRQINRLETRARIAGVWTPTDPTDDYWFILPSNLGDGFLVPREIFDTEVAEVMSKPYDFSIWYYALDDVPLRVEMVEPILSRIETLRNAAFAETKCLSLDTNLTRILNAFRRTSGELTLLMITFAAPLVVLVLYFIVLVSGMVVKRQESELVTFRSRGASGANVLLLYVAQSTLIGALAFVIGMPLGYIVAGLMSGTRTFLSFAGTARMSLEGLLAMLGPDSIALRFGLAAAIIAVLATLLPAAGVARDNVVSLSVDRGRNLRRPFWQRAYLDVLLLVPVIYGYVQLNQTGGLSVFGRSLSSDNPLRDPVRYLLPMMLMTSLALIVARLFPLVMRGLAAAANRLDGRLPATTSLLLAARELARSPADYMGPLLLLIVATGMAAFGASTAKTLDRHLIDSTYFAAGADVRLVEDGESNQPRFTGVFGGGLQEAAPRPEEKKPEYWTMMPVEEHAGIDGVLGYARLARLRVEPIVSNPASDNQLLVVDWNELQGVMQPAFRPDYAGESLGELLNRIGARRDAILVQPQFLSRHRLRPGDPLVVDVFTTEGRVPITYSVAGTFDVFPTVQPNPDRPLFVADIDYTFAMQGKAVPYDVLIASDPQADGEAIANNAWARGFLVSDVFDSRKIILDAQLTPERQGLFGVLTAGFLAAIVLTTVGFVLYAVLSFRRRAIELGVLRTLGLSSGQMALYLILAQLALVIAGTLAGSAAGVLAGRLFIPFFQMSGELVSAVPAFSVQIAWQELIVVYAALGMALAVALAATLLFLRRLRAFEVIKLGEMI
jgi:putative ABC transport system permease protein